MSEEEVVLEAPVEEEQVENPEEVEAKQKKAAMTAFIMGIIAFVLSGWFSGLLGIILGAIALGKAKKAKGVAVNPSKIFRLIGMILGILGLVSGILTLIGTILLVCLGGLAALGFGIYAIIIYAIPAIQESMEAAMVLMLPLL